MSKLITLIPLLSLACGTDDAFTATGDEPEAVAPSAAEYDFAAVRSELPVISDLEPSGLKGVSASTLGTAVEPTGSERDIWPANVVPGIYRIEVLEVYEDSCGTGVPDVMQGVVVRSPDTGERLLFDIAPMQTDGERLLARGNRTYPNPDYDCNFVSVLDAEGPFDDIREFDLSVRRMDQFVGTECSDDVPAACVWDYDAHFTWMGDFQDDGSDG